MFLSLTALLGCAAFASDPTYAPVPIAEAPAPPPRRPADPGATRLELSGGIYGLAWTRDGTGLVAAGAQLTEALGRTSGERRWAVPALAPITRSVASLHDSDLIVVGGDDAWVRILDARTGALVRDLAVLGEGPTDVCQRAQASIADGGELARRWCGDSPEWIAEIAVSPDDRLVAAVGMLGSVAVWELESGRRLPLSTEGLAAARLEGVAFSADGRFLLTTGDFRGPAVRAYDLQTGRGWRMPEDREPATSGCTFGMSVDIAPEGDRYAVGCFGGALEVRRFPSGELVWSDVPGAPNWAWPVRFSRDGRYLLAHAAYELHRYDAEDGEHHLVHSAVQASSMALSPDGRTLATAVNVFYGEIHLWSVESLMPTTVKPGAVPTVPIEPAAPVVRPAPPPPPPPSDPEDFVVPSVLPRESYE